jgi:uncharacterized protein with HEPN domain
MRSLAELLADMRLAITAIERRQPASLDNLLAEELLQVWIVHHLQIIGEAASKLPVAFKQQHPQLDWAAVIGMRHLLVHEYFDLDWEIVWRTVVQDLPALKVWLDSLPEIRAS